MTDPNAFDIPTGPIDREPLGSRHRGALEKQVILRDALLAAGIRAGDYDDRIVNWFADFADWGTFATITSWVQRAGQAPRTDPKTAAQLAEVARLRTELEHARALAADATEYRVHLPENGGTTLIVRRQALVHGMGWAVSTMGYGGGRAWTTEGWQESISALSVDRLFCWPDATAAVTEARRALAAPDDFRNDRDDEADAESDADR